MKTKLTFIGTALLLIFATGCPAYQEQADQTIQRKQEKLQLEAVKEVGLPNITRFTEMKRMRYLYELRDRADLTCWAYTRDLNGKLHLMGVMLGYPIPYGTQYSNPQKSTWVDGHGYFTMPQSEPNGLFMPPTAEATWVVLMTAKGPRAYYAETRIEGSPVRVPGADETQVIWPDGKPISPDVDEPPPAKDSDVKAVETKEK